MVASSREGPPAAPAIFLQDFVDVDRPAPAVSNRLAGGDWWLGPIAGEAGSDTETQLMRIGPASFRDWVARDVRVRIGPASHSGDAMLVPLRWEDARRPNLFPVLDGNLEVVPLGPNGCRVVLSATYRPPFDGVGHALDQTFLHRVAESTVRSFLTHLAQTLERDVPRGVLELTRLEGGVGGGTVGATGSGSDGDADGGAGAAGPDGDDGDTDPPVQSHEPGAPHPAAFPPRWLRPLG